MLAILRNLKEGIYRRISFRGNSPLDIASRKIFHESGFLKYVNDRKTYMTPNSKKIQIKTSKMVDTHISKEICQYVNKICKTDRTFTLDLYAVLIELMTNTNQHAYSKKSMFLVNEWYLFAEESSDYIQFVFLDTGEGIPNTVNQTFKDKDFIGDKESMLIKTAFEGKERTQTKKSNRGRGLPRVLEAFTEGNLKDLVIYSGKGSCKLLLENDDIFYCEDCAEQLYGTMFVWKIKK